MTTTLSKQLAIAPLIEAFKRRQLLNTGQNSVLFFPIGESFWIGSELWRGLAVVSPDVLLLIKKERLRAELDIPGTTSDANLAMCPKEPVVLDYADLPSIIVDDPNWPTPPVTNCEVTLLLRDHTRSVAPVDHTEQVQFNSEYPLVRVECALVGAENAVKALQRTAWLPPAPIKIKTQPRMTVPWLTILLSVAAVVALVATTVLLQKEDVSILAAMLICLPVLGGILGALTWVVCRNKPIDPFTADKP